MKKFMSIMCTAAIAAGVLSGCGEKPVKTIGLDDPVTLSIYDANVKYSFGNDPVSQEIIKKTGVTLDFMQATGDDKEKLNIMLASSTYPDILLIGRSTGLIEKFVSAKALRPLNDLIDEYAPLLEEQYGEILDRERNQDGNIYGLPNWYSLDESPVLGFLIKQDFLMEVADEEIYEGDTHITQDQLIEYLQAFKEKHPQIDGKESIPMTIFAENWGSFIGSFKGMFGLKGYHEEDGKIYFSFRDPKFKDMLAYINQIHQLDLIDREWATNKEQLWKQKLSSGAVFTTMDAYWNAGDPNKILSDYNKDEEKKFLPYKVVADGVDPNETTYSGRNPMGWDIVSITSSNPYPERTMKFLDYIASDEGQILIRSGVEKLHYDVVNGKREMKPELIEPMKQDYSTFMKDTGIRYWSICVKNGNAKDGLPYGIGELYNDDKATLFAQKTLQGTVWDESPYSDLTPTGGSIEALTYKKIDEMSKEYITKMVNAADDAEFESLWNAFITEADNLGAAKVEEIFTDNYIRKQQAWNR